MNFRVGSMTIPVLTSVVYQLREEGKLRLTQPISKWLPGIPRASRVSIRMLMNNTSGYLDWIQGNDEFVDALYADPFRFWPESELLTTALGRGLACDPGTCFHYAHTNYLILARVVRKVAPGTLVSQLRKRVLNPTGVKMNFSRVAPIPVPVLSAFTPERGVFEDSTNWSPSWGLGNGMLATTSIDQPSPARTSTVPRGGDGGAQRALGTIASKNPSKRSRALRAARTRTSVPVGSRATI